MQFYLIDWLHKHTHTRTPKRKLTCQVFIGGQSLFSDLPASCGLRRSGVAGLEPTTQCRSKPRQVILAGQARRHTGHKRRRSVGGTPGRRRLASEDHQTSEDQQTILNSLKTRRQLSTTTLVWPTRASLIPRSHSLIGQRERSMPIFGAKPERNACAHIWG